MTKVAKRHLTRDEEADEIVRRLSAPPKTGMAINIAMIKNILPDLIASEILSVQPMSGSVERNFIMKFIYGNENNKTKG
jgi:hypothetical protein